MMRLVLAILLFALAASEAWCQQATPSAAPPSFCDQVGKSVEHPEALEDACRFVLSLRQRLPNVICDQTTSRYIRPPLGDVGKRLTDVVTAHVIYEDGHERYSDLKINGKPQTNPMSEVQGQYSRGEFGTDLIFAFQGENHAAYRFLRKDSLTHHHVFVYEAKILREDNHGWVLSTNDRTTYPEFDAEISVDQTTHDIVQFEVKATPGKDFPVSDVEVSTQYEDLPLGDGTHFVLPTLSVSGSCLWNDSRRRMAFCNENELEFTNCHKFGASSRIVTDGVSDAPK